MTKYVSNIPDKGPNGFGITLLDNQSSYDPIFVDNQGLYFNSNKFIQTTKKWIPGRTNSITVESWIRPSNDVISGTLLSFDYGTNQQDVVFGFSGGNIVLTIGGVSTTLPITYTAAMKDTWSYVGISIFKTSATTSRVCISFATDAEQ
jgi:hypothetical protein